MGKILDELGEINCTILKPSEVSEKDFTLVKCSGCVNYVLDVRLVSHMKVCQGNKYRWCRYCKCRIHCRDFRIHIKKSGCRRFQRPVNYAPYQSLDVHRPYMNDETYMYPNQQYVNKNYMYPNYKS